MTKFNESIFIHAGSDAEISKKKKRGKSLSDIFGLMQSLLTLQEEIMDVMDGVEDESLKKQIKEFGTHIDAMYDKLVEITKEGVRKIRKEDTNFSDESIDESSRIRDRARKEDAQSEFKPAIVTSPKIPFGPAF